MSRKKLPPRLTFRASEGVWIIRDGTTYKRTGCGLGDTQAAQEALSEYISRKWQPDTAKSRQRDINLTDVIMIYVNHKSRLVARPEELDSSAARLVAFWGDKFVSDIIGSTCRKFIKQSSTPAMARRDLENLRPAVKHYKKEHGLDVVPEFTMPEKSGARTRWLTRSEAARLLWAAYRAGNNHVVRFILIGIYTGTRSGGILSLQWHPNTVGGWVDLEAGLIYREPPSKKKTKKRAPPVVIPRRLLPHLKRWAKNDAGRHVIHWKGHQISKISRAFNNAVKSAKLDEDVIPHCLRHTAATWMMQRGAPLWKAAKTLGMTTEILESTYGHHHPDYLDEMRDIF